MQERYAVSISLIAVAIAIVLAIVVLGPFQKELVVEGVSIDSSGQDPYALFAGLSQKSTILVSPQMNERAEAVDHLMFNGMALFLQVVEGNNRQAVQVIRVYGTGNEIGYCLTNYGDVNRSETMQREECLEYISQENAGVVLIEFPDPNLPRPVLEISEGRLVVRPKSNEDISKTCFLAIRIMFKNSQQILGRASAILGAITG